jgi:hypothetical protein
MGVRQQGQLVSSGSIVTWRRGKWAGSEPRLARRFSARAAGVVIGFGGGNGLLDVLKR